LYSTELSTLPVAPVSQAERVQIVDILRGFALFGILLVNMAIFYAPFQQILFPADPAAAWYDRAATWLIHFLAESKFYTLFSMLFGLGLTLLMDRIQARGGRFAPLYLRRLFVLLLIGLVHAFLIWPGDILIVYALLGVLLIFFRKAKPRTLLIWAVILIAIPILFNLGAQALIEVGRAVPEGAAQIDAAMAEVEAGYLADVERANRVYANGSFGEITAQRAYDYTSLGLLSFFALGFNVLGLFLIGIYFGKRQIFQNLETNLPLLRKMLLWGLLIGLPANAIYATLIMDTARFAPSGAIVIATLVQGVGAPLLMLGYVAALSLLSMTPAWGARLKALAPVGQMALTNYLTQSIVCTLIFYGYGLGLFGKIGAAAGILLTIVIFLLQIPFSHWWMRRFRYGPAEWLWRSLTYLKLQPMRRLALGRTAV
jgi:uncharacterized protein